MVGHREEILGPSPFIQRYQFLRIPILSLPSMDNVFEPEPRRVSIVLNVKFVLVAAFLIHGAGVPVAILRLALRPPMCPNPKLGVPKPVRRLVLLQRIPRRLKWAGRYSGLFVVGSFA